MSRNKIFVALAGGTGGASPALLRWANALVKTPEAPLEVGLSFIVAILIFFVMGAVIVLVFAEDNLRKAFFLGVGLPALLNIQIGEQLNSEHAKLLYNADSLAGAFFTSSAFAQDAKSTKHWSDGAPTTSGVWIPGRRLEILDDQKKRVSVEFVDETLRTIAIVSHSTKPRAEWIHVPENATSLRFKRHGKDSELYKLIAKPGVVNQYEVNTTERKKLTFWSAFGGSPRWEVDFNAKRKEIPNVNSGTEGWIFLGNAGSDPNQRGTPIVCGKTFNDLQKGDIVQMYGPINMSSKIGKPGVRIGIVGIDQPIEVKDIVIKENKLWLKALAVDTKQNIRTFEKQEQTGKGKRESRPGPSRSSAAEADQR